MDLVADHIYISSDEAGSLDLLQKHGIAFVVSLGHGFTPLFDSQGIVYHLVAIDDETSENALDHFDAAVEFIGAAVSQKANVLVHCMAGVSRAPTFVAAYLMRSLNIGAEEAVASIRTKRDCVDPNEGFISQLEIYKRMGCKLNVESSDYRRFLLSQAASEQQQLGTLTKLKMTADPTKSHQSKTRCLRCRMCRRVLLREDSILPHESGIGQTAFQYRKRDTAIEQLSSTGKGNASKCSSHCVEPMEWMTEVGEGYVEGKILCPGKCGGKLGSFSWSGIACPCGTWVAPAFMINKQKVDIVGLL
ncbi:dual specificity phosphatase 12 [Podochytrium sp. JEL0797]|nr:dual specificity phosphatase 12 [Podochytrium sp. JEL0797]